MIEPYLMQQGLVMRTPRGRVAAPRAWVSGQCFCGARRRIARATFIVPEAASETNVAATMATPNNRASSSMESLVALRLGEQTAEPRVRFRGFPLRQRCAAESADT
mgnify:CR=1 FL=1